MTQRNNRSPGYANFNCPNCGFVATDVADSRPSTKHGGLSVMRKRDCPKCYKRFTTYEIREDLLGKALSATDTAIEAVIRKALTKHFKVEKKR